MKREEIIHEALLIATGLHGTADRLMRAAEDENLAAIASISLPSAPLAQIQRAISDAARRDRVRAAVTSGAQMAGDAGVRINERSLLIDFIVDAIDAADKP